MPFFRALSFARFAILLLPILGIAIAIQVGCTFSSDNPIAPADSGTGNVPDASVDAPTTAPDANNDANNGGGNGSYGYGYGYGCGADDTDYGYSPYGDYGYGTGYGDDGYGYDSYGQFGYGDGYGTYGYGYGYGCNH